MLSRVEHEMFYNPRAKFLHPVVFVGSVWVCGFFFLYSKTGLKRPLKKKTKIGFQDRLSLNAGQKYCRMLQESILQYFQPSLSYHLSLRPLFCLFLSGRLRQILLYQYENVLDLQHGPKQIQRWIYLEQGNL